MPVRGFARSVSTTVGYLITPKIQHNTKVHTCILGDDAHFFVGYHDHDPISADGDQILCHRINRRFTNCIEPEYGQIGLLSISTCKFSPLATVGALNWQLGSRAQWFDEQTVIFNDLKDNKHCSKVINCRSGEVINDIPWAFWGISPNRQLGVSLNFAVLKEKRAGYGYKGTSPDGTKDILRIYELDRHRVVAEFSFADVINQLGINYSDNDEGYFNHICWNPDSTKFITVVCWESAKLKKRLIYGVLFNLTKGSVKLLNTSGFFSHHTWLSDDRIVAYLDINGRKGYYIWQEEDIWRDFNCTFPQEDGHPTTVEPDKAVVVDTYPDKFSRMRLFRCSIDPEAVCEELLVVSNNPKFTGPLRCDLHPRFSAPHQRIVCDMPSYETRKILVVDPKR
jgi:hypothetical protein